MVQKYMKMKNTTDSQENLFILRKSLGMVSIPIIHRNASRIDWGNSFILNNFSLPMFHKLICQANWSTISFTWISPTYWRFEAPLIVQRNHNLTCRTKPVKWICRLYFFHLHILKSLPAMPSYHSTILVKCSPYVSVR